MHIEPLHVTRFPRSSGYDTKWIIDNAMGPHVLWLAEWLSEVIELRAGMRVLDLGCGRAISSIFLAREFGVSVVATDLGPTDGESGAH
jgi:methylase of polypeptide subunit release factors